MSVRALTRALTLVCLFFSINAVIISYETSQPPLLLLSTYSGLHLSFCREGSFLLRPVYDNAFD